MSRERIPLDLQILVRKRDNYSCVMCNAIFPLEVDHIEEYHIVKEHILDNLATLCSSCHLKKTQKKIKKEDIIYHRDNKEREVSKEEILKVDGRRLFHDINICGYSTKNSNKTILRINQQKIAWFNKDKEGSFKLFNFKYYGPCGNLVFKIEDNYISNLIPDEYDMDSSGNKIVIRKINKNKKNSIVLDFNYEEYHSFTVNKMISFLHNLLNIKYKYNKLNINGNEKSIGNFIVNECEFYNKNIPILNQETITSINIFNLKDTIDYPDELKKEIHKEIILDLNPTIIQRFFKNKIDINDILKIDFGNPIIGSIDYR